ncbi:MAG: hypothetical protein ACLPX7_27800 [Xanthobacteraceae bacterium]
MSLAYESNQGAGADRPQDVRVITSIPGSFSISRKGLGGARAVFACRAVNLSTTTVAFTAAAVDVKIGDQILATVEQIGTLEGAVAQLLKGGFVVNITASEEERDKLRRKITWLERHKNFDVLDARTKPRLIPRNPRAKMILPDGKVESCTMLDLSVSGTAVSAKIIPEIGGVLAINNVVGRVVRHFEHGFAVRFIEDMSDEDVHAMVTSN